MQVAYDLIQLLKDGRFHSGTVLAQKLRVGRTSIWKAVEVLRNLGVAIDAVKGRGYRLTHVLELLNRSQILNAMDSAIAHQIHQLTIVPVVTSTNDYLWSQLSYGQKPFSICLSEAQTQGKGRQGKKWQSPFGKNLYLSIYGCCSVDRQLSGMSLMVAMTVLKTISKFSTVPEGMGIKWPNDILFQGKKVAGILIETQRVAGQETDQMHYVIGIGINIGLKETSSQEQDWADFQSILHSPPSRNEFSAQLISQIILDLNLFTQDGFDSFHQCWAQYDLLKNQKIMIQTPHTSEIGQYCGINKRGELLVDVNGQLKAMTYGDVSVRLG